MISREEVEHVARLARLRFDEDELARLQPELGQIIDYVQQLSELDLSGLEPTSHAVALKNVLRPDEPRARADPGRGCRQRAGGRAGAVRGAPDRLGRR